MQMRGHKVAIVERNELVGRSALNPSWGFFLICGRQSMLDVLLSGPDIYRLQNPASHGAGNKNGTSAGMKFR